MLCNIINIMPLTTPARYYQSYILDVQPWCPLIELPFLTIHSNLSKNCNPRTNTLAAEPFAAQIRRLIEEDRPNYSKLFNLRLSSRHSLFASFKQRICCLNCDIDSFVPGRLVFNVSSLRRTLVHFVVVAAIPAADVPVCRLPMQFTRCYKIFQQANVHFVTINDAFVTVHPGVGRSKA